MRIWIIAYDYQPSIKHYQYITLYEAFKRRGCLVEIIHHPDLILNNNILYYKNNIVDLPDIGIMKVFPSDKRWLEKFKYLEKMGTLLLNKTNSLFTYGDKIDMYEKLKLDKIPIPKTLCIKLPYQISDIDEIEKIIGWPCVIKPNMGRASLGVTVCETRNDLFNLVIKMQNDVRELTHLIVQKIIKSNHMIYFNAIGQETFYCNIAYGRSNWLSKTNHRNNKLFYDREYILIPYKPNENLVDLMRMTMKSLDYDLARGEIFIDENLNPIICELNGTGHFNLQSITFRENLADHIAEYAIQKYNSSTTWVCH
jgi:hypothetical protein